MNYMNYIGFRNVTAWSFTKEHKGILCLYYHLERKGKELPGPGTYDPKLNNGSPKWK